MTFEQLKQKAHSLPAEPGVYLMQDKTGEIIYVGKAKKLRNRVSQYFQDSAAHTPKTRKMVSRIDSFDTIAARSEFEALVLECSLIKRHMPKYNILLKDAKGYPYVRVDLKQAYPRITMANRAQNDGAQYFGPFGGRYMTQHLIDTLRVTFQLPGCGKKFPQEIGKERPCLNHHMNNCRGWCQPGLTQEQYHEAVGQAVQVLQGNYRQVTDRLQAQMEQASEALAFEQAAALRDQIKAVRALGEKQLVTAGARADTDVIGYFQNDARACFAVLHYIDGNLIDKDYELVPGSDAPNEALSSLIKQYYLSRAAAPALIYIPMPMEDAALFERLLLQQLNLKVRIRVPQRGEKLRLIELANTNARQEAERVTTKQEQTQALLQRLGQMLHLPQPPHRIESYDISNIDGTDIVASMVVFEDGKPLKSGYRRFKVENMPDQNDIASMRQVLRRRFVHYQQHDKGFEQKPDLLLIDGGSVHAGAVCDELRAMGLEIPTYGMVKDSRHRTRALLSPQAEQISIAAIPALFALIGQIQEQTHRFAVTYHRELRSGRLKASQLDQIAQVGPKRKQALLRHFHTLSAIRAASVEQLQQVVPRSAAEQIYQFYHRESERGT